MLLFSSDSLCWHLGAGMPLYGTQNRPKTKPRTPADGVECQHSFKNSSKPLSTANDSRLDLRHNLGSHLGLGSSLAASRRSSLALFSAIFSVTASYKADVCVLLQEPASKASEATAVEGLAESAKLHVGSVALGNGLGVLWVQKQRCFSMIPWHRLHLFAHAV